MKMKKNKESENKESKKNSSSPDSTGKKNEFPVETTSDGRVIQKTGIDILLNTKNAKYERLPMLEVIFDRLTRYMTKSIRGITYENIEVTMGKIESMKFSNYLESIEKSGLVAVIKAEELGGFILLRLNYDLVMFFIEVMLGGHKENSSKYTYSTEKRFSTLELKLIERLVEVILADLSSAFDPITYINFSFDRIETNSKFATITRDSNAVIKIEMKMTIESKVATLDFVIPYATIEPIREILLQMFFGEKLGKDNIWELHLITELLETETKIDAVLKELKMPLKDILSWKPGDTFELNVPEDPDIEIRAGNIPLFYGKIGRILNNISVQIDREVEQK